MFNRKLKEVVGGFQDLEIIISRLQEEEYCIRHDIAELRSRIASNEDKVGDIFGILHSISGSRIPMGYLQDEIEAIKNYLGIDTVVVEGTHPYLEAVEWEEE